MTTKTKAKKSKRLPAVGGQIVLQVTKGDIAKAYRPSRSALGGCLIATTARRNFPRMKISCGLDAVSVGDAELKLDRKGTRLIKHWCENHFKTKRPEPQEITLTRTS